MNIYLGATMAKKPYYRPELKQIERVVALLCIWSEWRGTVRRALLSHMQPRCTLGRLVQMTRQPGEVWKHNEVPDRPVFDEQEMQQVSRIVAELPTTHKEAVMVEYVTGGWRSQRQKARKLRISDRHYRRVLFEAHEIINQKMRWS